MHNRAVKPNTTKLALFCATILALSLAPAGADGLVNGNFNTGDTSSWWTYLADPTNSAVAVESDTAFSFDGTPYLHVICRNASGDPLMGQDPAVPGGSSYQVSLEYRANNWGGAGVGIHYLDATWTQIGYEWVTFYTGNGTDTGWQSFSTPTWLAPANTAYVEVRLDGWGWSDTYVDNVSLDVIPEPGSGLLIGIGGLVGFIARLADRRVHAFKRQGDLIR